MKKAFALLTTAALTLPMVMPLAAQAEEVAVPKLDTAPSSVCLARVDKLHASLNVERAKQDVRRDDLKLKLHKRVAEKQADQAKRLVEKRALQDKKLAEQTAKKLVKKVVPEALKPAFEAYHAAITAAHKARVEAHDKAMLAFHDAVKAAQDARAASREAAIAKRRAAVDAAIATLKAACDKPEADQLAAKAAYKKAVADAWAEFHASTKATHEIYTKAVKAAQETRKAAFEKAKTEFQAAKEAARKAFEAARAAYKASQATQEVK